MKHNCFSASNIQIDLDSCLMNRLTCSRISWLATLCPSEAPKFQNICLIKRAEDFFMRPHGFLVCTLSYLTVFIGRIVITQCALQINFRQCQTLDRQSAARSCHSCTVRTFRWAFLTVVWGYHRQDRLP